MNQNRTKRELAATRTEPKPNQNPQNVTQNSTLYMKPEQNKNRNSHGDLAVPHSNLDEFSMDLKRF